MWYFAWILGLGLAVSFGVLNGMWHEFDLPVENDDVSYARVRISKLDQ